jgi:hypothetical protein
MEGSRTKSVGGSSRDEHDKNGEEHMDTNVLDWFGPPESKTLCPVWWWNYAESGSPLEWSPRPPYMDNRLGFPLEVGGPVSGSVTRWKAIFLDYKGYPVTLGLTGGIEPRPSDLSCTPSLVDPPRSG